MPAPRLNHANDFKNHVAVGLASSLALLIMPTAASAQHADGVRPTLHVSGGMRVRHESLARQSRPGEGSSDYVSVYRASIAAELRYPGLTLGAELLDSRALDFDKGGQFGVGDVNALEPIQAYVRLHAGDTTWTAGRFFQNIGSRRLIARSMSGNAPTSFLGVAMEKTGGEGQKFTGLYVLPALRQPDDREAFLDNRPEVDRHTNARRLFGAFYTNHPLSETTRADLYALQFVDIDEPGRATRDRRLTVAGARIFRNPAEGALDYEVEVIRQTGTARATSNPSDRRDLEVSAAAVHAEVGYSSGHAWKPRVELGFDYGSGDKDPTDGGYGRFEGLFGSNRGDFGPGGLYGVMNRSNILSPSARLELEPAPRWEGYATYRLLWLAQSRDSFANTDVRDRSGQSGRFAGQQIEGRVRHRLRRNLVWEVGGAWLLAGRFMDRATQGAAGDGSLYGYTDLTMTF